MEKRFDVIGVENLMLDAAIQINHLPETDGSASVRALCWNGGGNISSAVVATARLGGACGMVGTAGDDIFGDFCVADLERHGIDVSHLLRKHGSTTLDFCLAEETTQGRSFLGLGGDCGDMTAEEVREDYIAQARVLHCTCGNSPFQRQAREYAKKNGVELSLDAAGYSESNRELAEQMDILITSEFFYKGMFGDDEDYIGNCRKLMEKGPKIVIVTLGKRGCVGVDAYSDFRLGAFSGHPIVDTTGAGDVFHGAFLYAYLKRYRQAPYNYTVEDCARFASAVSYIDCTTLGGRTGIPTLEMVDRFLEDGTILPGDIEKRKAFYCDAIFDPNKRNAVNI